jgi:hypothetical protein
MFSIAARFHVLIWVAWTPNFFDNSESVISSRIASSATLALNSGAWFFLFAISDQLSLQAIHLNNWSEIPRPPLLETGRFVWPSAKEGKIALTAAQLAMLPEGIDWRMPQRSWKPLKLG